MATSLFEFNTTEPRLKEAENSLSQRRHLERQRLIAASDRYYGDPTAENEAVLTDALDRFASLVLRCVPEWRADEPRIVSDDRDSRPQSD
ncbi:MAG: hypothetical protein WDO73_02230 [Ignavibacteriota bacterium]